MVNRRRKTQKGSGIFNRVRNFVIGRKPDQQLPEIGGGPLISLNQPGYRNWENAVIINSLPTIPVSAAAASAAAPPSPSLATIPGVINQNELERLLAVTPSAAPAPAAIPVEISTNPAAPTAPATAPAAPAASAATAAPAATAASAVIPDMPPNILSEDQNNRILFKFFNLLQRSPRLDNDFYIAKTSNPQFRNPILEELSFDPVTRSQRSTSFKIINHIPEFGAAGFPSKIGQAINRGSYGTIYKHRTDPTRVIKSMLYVPRNDNEDDFLKNSLRETFIQLYLSEAVPGSVPMIYSFAKNKVGSDLYYYIEMERVGLPYVSVLDYIVSLGNRITFDIFYAIVHNICYTLINMQNYTSFVHRDFKENNMMFNPITGEVKIIDFGLSFIRIAPDYIIVNNAPNYRPNAAIRYQQDMGLFFLFFRQFFISGTEPNYITINDPRIRQFIEAIIPPSLTGRTHYFNAYNINGSVYANTNTEILTPRAVLNALSTFRATGRIRGGKRSDQKRSDQKRMKRRTRRRRTYKS